MPRKRQQSDSPFYCGYTVPPGTVIEPDLTGVPEVLKQLPNWVCYIAVPAGNRLTKPPINPNTGKLARTDNPATWTTFDAAAAFYAANKGRVFTFKNKGGSVCGSLSGIGFVLTRECGIVGIDLDHAIDENGVIASWAFEVLKRFATYSEISVSGTGLHILVKGKLPEAALNKKPLNKTPVPGTNSEIERYQNGRYFTVTGRAIKGFEGKGVTANQSGLDWLDAAYFQQKPSSVDSTGKGALWASYDLSKALQDKRDAVLMALWNGERPNKNESRDDLGLMNKLAWYTNRDESAMREAFEQSPHYQTKDAASKDKWDNRADYRERTITKAIEDVLNRGAEILTGKRTRFEVRDNGVFYCRVDTDEYGDDKPAPGRFICGKLEITAMARKQDNSGWSLLLKWVDRDGGNHEELFPLNLFSGDCAAVRTALLDGGLHIQHSKTKADAGLLVEYLLSTFPERRVRIVSRPGWNENRYILPETTIGGENGAEETLYQKTPEDPKYSVSGSVEDWKNSVAAFARGNPVVVFTLSAGFTGPLLSPINAEGGGFHLYQSSSKGKTTSLLAAASIWGAPDVFMKTWRATGAALEAIAGAHNDNVLLLDEIGHARNLDVAEIVYGIANGAVKNRANQQGGLQKAAEPFRVIYLSSGELPLKDFIAAQNGKAPEAGAEIRHIDIEMPGFDNLHGLTSAREFADNLVMLARKFYGAVGMEFLRKLVDARGGGNIEILQKSIYTFIHANVPANASGQIYRIARRFGLVAAAGELATTFGLTGWEIGEADAAAQEVFHQWLENFGTGDREALRAVSQLKAFMESQESRFQDMDGFDPAQKTINRAGFFRTLPIDGENEKTFWILPEVFRNEILRGLNFKQAIKTLCAAGCIVPGKDKTSQVLRVPAVGKKPIRAYQISDTIWSAETT